MHIKFHILNKNFHSQNQDHLIVHFTRNGRVNKTNFYHMQVLLQFPKGNDFKTELRRANSCIRSLRASDGQNGPNFFGTLVKCGNNELSRFTIQFFEKITKETTMHIQAFTLHNMTNKSNSTITYYYKDILYSRKQRQKNLGLHRYLTDWKLNSSKNKIRVSNLLG